MSLVNLRTFHLRQLLKLVFVAAWLILVRLVTFDQSLCDYFFVSCPTFRNIMQTLGIVLLRALFSSNGNVANHDWRMLQLLFTRREKQISLNSMPRIYYLNAILTHIYRISIFQCSRNYDKLRAVTLQAKFHSRYSTPVDVDEFNELTQNKKSGYSCHIY